MSEIVEQVKHWYFPRGGRLQRLPLADLYQQLSFSEAKELATYAVALMLSGNLTGDDDILINLACYVPRSLEDAHPQLVELGVFMPGLLYRGASEGISQRLISQLNAPDFDGDANQLLVALSWIGDANVVQAFKAWRTHTQHWMDELYVTPDKYSYVAGWELNSIGQRRNLYLETCYALIKPTSELPTSSSPAKIATDDEACCPWCKLQLTVLFDLDIARLAFMHDQDGKRLKIVTCIYCAIFTPIFSKIDWQGGAVWSELNKRPDYWADFEVDSKTAYRIPKDSLIMAPTPRNALAVADLDLVKVSRSQIGGHPFWVQDADYPICVSCQKTMLFIGQLDLEDLDYEGLYYAFICNDCDLVATSHQQT